MEFLSLEQPEPPRGRMLTGLEAQIASLVLHLVAALLIIFVPRHLPESVRAFFRPAPPPIPAVATPAPPDAAAAAPKPRPIPLQFSYVDPSVRVPDDQSVKENPRAPILSNRNRIARQEAPTPKEERRLSIDPHSEGNTIARVRPDPTRPEGPESAEPEPAEPPQARGAAGSGETARGGSGSPAEDGGREIEAMDGPGAPARRPAGPSGNGPQAAGPAGPLIDPRERVREMLRDVQTGEFKETFHNPAYLRDGSLGAMSFDTKDFPWGDYERQVYLRIVNNWRERLPLAFREGQRGYLCLRYVMRQDGTITDIDVVRPSSVPPFNNAVLDALRASSPLPPLPENFPRDSEGVSWCFFYNMWPGEVGR